MSCYQLVYRLVTIRYGRPAQPDPKITHVSNPTPDDIVRALRRGPATPDALAARLGDVDRDAMWWAVNEAVQQGTVSLTAELECGPDGLCGVSVPTVFSLVR